MWLAECVTFHLHELVFGRETHRVAKIIGGCKYTLCNQLVQAFGLSETMEHFWAIVNGSSIPEASIICDIISDLAKNLTEQEDPRTLGQGDVYDSYPYVRRPFNYKPRKQASPTTSAQ